jgi:hypothetical protein
MKIDGTQTTHLRSKQIPASGPDGYSALLHVMVHPTSDGDRPRWSFGCEMMHAWKDAQRAVLSVLPWLPAQPDLHILSDPRIEGPVGQVPAAVNGSSSGLAMAMALTATLLGLKVPRHHVFSATIHADGTLGAVDGVQQKAQRCEREDFGEVSYVLWIAKGCTRSGVALRHGSLKEATHLLHVINTVWPDASPRLTERFSGPGGAGLVREVLMMALHGQRHPGMVWKGVEQLARTGYDYVSSPEDRTALKLAAHIAARHDSLDPASLRGLPPFREARSIVPDPESARALCAHYLQYASEQWELADQDALELATRRLIGAQGELRPAADLENGDLRILGAYARWWLSEGAVEDAWKCAMHAVRAWLDRSLPDEASRPLCTLHAMAPVHVSPSDRSLLEEQTERFLEVAPRRGCDIRWVKQAQQIALAWMEGAAPMSASSLHAGGETAFGRWVHAVQRAVISSAPATSFSWPEVEEERSDHLDALRRRMERIIQRAPGATARAKAEWIARVVME